MHNCKVCGKFTQKKPSQKHKEKRVCPGCGHIEYIRE